MNLKTLKDSMKHLNDSGDLRKWGSCDARVGFRSGKKCYQVVFDAFEIAGVSEIDADDLLEVDFYIDMKKKDWDSYLKDINAGTAKSLVEMDLNDGIVKSADERRKLAFLQYHMTFETFLSSAAAR